MHREARSHGPLTEDRLARPFASRRHRWRLWPTTMIVLALAVAVAVAVVPVNPSPPAASAVVPVNPSPPAASAVVPVNPSPPAASAASSGLPCDVFESGGNKCVAAYSTVRLLRASYTGPLYNVTRASDGTSADIGVSSGYADSAAQDSFCQATVCIIGEIYDQSTRGNHLTIAPVGPAGSSGVGARADALPMTAGGQQVYGVLFDPRVAYRRTSGNGLAVGGMAESVYWVASGAMATDYCCFDFGNVEKNPVDKGGAGSMNALIMSTFCGAPPCTGTGPWVQADLEKGVFMGGGSSNPANVSQTSPFVTGVLRNDGQTSFALDAGDATAATLDSLYSGPLPPGYGPMNLEGGIGLGAGGDNSNAAPGAFFEGAIVSGYPSNSTVATVQSDIASVNYSGTSGGGPGVGITGPGGKCVDVYGDDIGVNGAKVQLWDCQHDAVDQHWLYSRAGAAADTLKTMGRCLDVDGNATAPGTPVQLWDCNGVGGQEWVPHTNGALLNPQSNLCLTARGGGTANGTRLEIQGCTGGLDQRFIITPGLLLRATPINGPGGKCVDVLGDNIGVNGSKVVAWDCLREANDQGWWATPNGSLTTLGRCLNIVGNGTESLTKVELFDCNGTGGQQWVQQHDGLLLNPQSGLCLTDPTAGTTNGTVLHIESCDSNKPGQGFFVSGGQMISAPDGKCVDTSGDDTYGNWHGPHVQIWDCIEHAADQHWVMTIDGTVESMTRCLNVAGNSTASGSPVNLFNCNGTGGQQWIQQADGSLMNPPSGKCLTSPSTSNGTQLIIQACSGGADQKFVLCGAAALQPGMNVSLRATTACCTNDFV